MNLGFYYHIPLFKTANKLQLPAYLGLFVDEVAKQVETLTLFMHEATASQSVFCDYTLKAKNIKFINLGVKTPAWQRFLSPNRTLKGLKEDIKLCDAVLVRAPSPLAPAFYRYFGENTKICYLVVGDYNEGVKYLSHQPFVRRTLIKLLSERNDRQLSKAIKKALTLVNSVALLKKYQTISENIRQVRTTTLTENDFFEREDTCSNKTIQILFTGRIDLSKGLMELLDATAMLIKKGYDIRLNLVGWEDNTSKPIQKTLTDKAKLLHIEDKVLFHGMKKAGEELNNMYRIGDMYVIPSYHEGFPRTIWEAMANGLPVIATKVGSIPYFLESENNALLINAGEVQELETAMTRIIDDKKLRKILIKNGKSLVKENTLEKQTKLLIEVIETNL